MSDYEMSYRRPLKKGSRRRRRNRIIKFTAVAVVEVLLLCVVLVCKFVQDKYNKIYVPPLPTGAETIATNEFVDPTYQEVVTKKFSTYLVIGVDAVNQEQLVKGTNSDVLIVLSINNETNEIRMASIYRDTHCMLGNDTMGKINSELSRRGAYATVSVINKNYDLQIDGFICVNWASVARLVNDLGGVELDIKENMMEITVNGEKVPYLNGLISQVAQATGLPTCQIFETGVRLCDGVQTVAYCRLRKKDSDFMRTDRQREVIGKILAKAKAAPLTTLNEAANHVLSGIAMGSTDSDDPNAAKMIDYFMGFIPKINKISIADSTGFPYEHRTVMGYMKNDVMPVNLEANVQKLHRFLYGTENYECSEYVKNLSEAMRVEGGFDSQFNYIGE